MRTILLLGLLLTPAGRAFAAAALTADELPELDPLNLTVPRDRIKAMIDPSINAQLLRLLRTRRDARVEPQALLDASVGNLVKLTTVTGYKLKTRYTELGFLLTEGLAGVKDISLASELENVARSGSNVQTRAAALVALAYTKDPRYVPLFQSALQDPNVTVRFGAVESLIIMGAPEVRALISRAANEDRSPVLRAYAAAGAWRLGDVYGREILLRLYQDNDWLVRAVATRYLGELGGADEYLKLSRQLDGERDPMVKAELCSALLRLQAYNVQ